jgi:hypothetical protein
LEENGPGASQSAIKGKGQGLDHPGRSKIEHLFCYGDMIAGIRGDFNPSKAASFRGILAACGKKRRNARRRGMVYAGIYACVINLELGFFKAKRWSSWV